LFGAGWGYRGSFLAIVSAWGVRCRLLEGRPGALLFFCGPKAEGRRTTPARSSHLSLISEGTRLKKTACVARGPARGKGQRGTATAGVAPPRGMRASPDQPPHTPLGAWWLPPPGARRCPPRPLAGPGGEKRPRAAPGPWVPPPTTNHQPQTRIAQPKRDRRDPPHLVTPEAPWP
jgi:hypothetical protein